MISPMKLEIAFKINPFLKGNHWFIETTVNKESRKKSKHAYLDFNIKKLIFDNWSNYITSLKLCVSENEEVMLGNSFCCANLQILRIKGTVRIKRADVVYQVLKSFILKHSATLQVLDLTKFSFKSRANGHSLDLAGKSFFIRVLLFYMYVLYKNVCFMI